jgi:hypothetical protein
MPYYSDRPRVAYSPGAVRDAAWLAYIMASQVADVTTADTISPPACVKWASSTARGIELAIDACDRVRAELVDLLAQYRELAAWAERRSDDTSAAV